MCEKQPLVSVIIPFYNCPYVSEAIDSVLKQTYKEIEIIVVNDGSTKHVDLVGPYLSKIMYIEQLNMGVASALNQGLKHANGDYIVWLSSDDLFDKKKIELQLQFMLESNSDMSFTNFNIINENNQITKYNVGKNFTSEFQFLQSLRDYCPINGCTIMMTKSIRDNIGYFDETLRYVQDYDYWIRTALQYPINYFHSTLTNYRVHKNMGSIVHNKEQMDEFYRVREKYRDQIDCLIEMIRNGTDV